MERDTRSYLGFSHWLQIGVYLVLFGVFALWLLSALNQVKEAAERQEVDLTIRNIRVGIRLGAMEALLLNRGREVLDWVGDNPIHWLGGLPRGYLGECPAFEPFNVPAGTWCFDSVHRDLIYRPRYSGHLRHQTTEAGVCEDLRWRVVRAGSVQSAEGFVGVRLEAVSSCLWSLDGK